MITRLQSGDSLELMKDISDASVDAVITDPPYGIGFTYKGQKEVADNPEDYWKWFEPYFNEIQRIVVDGGLIAIWQHYRYMQHIWKWFGTGIDIFIHARNFTDLHGLGIESAFNPVVMFYKNTHRPSIRTKNKRRKMNYFVANWSVFHFRGERIGTQHPCALSLDVCEHIIKNFTGDNWKVCDPFLGSGQIGIACAKLDRNFIGMEINPDYFAIAQKRITDAQQSAQVTV